MPKKIKVEYVRKGFDIRRGKLGTADNYSKSDKTEMLKGLGLS